MSTAASPCPARASRIGLALMALSVSPPAMAQSWNAAADFSPASNPSGVWSYGASNPAATTAPPPDFVPADAASPLGPCPDVDTWSVAALGLPPGVYHNSQPVDCVFDPTLLIPANVLFLHPGPANEHAVLRFTAPVTGFYDAQATFTGLDTLGTSQDAHVSIGGVDLFAQTLAGSGDSASFNGVIRLQGGEGADFSVGLGTDGSFLYDSVALDLALTRQLSLTVTPDPLIAGQPATFSVDGADPAALVALAYSVTGPGSTFLPPLNLTLDLDAAAQLAGPSAADGVGFRQWTLTPPAAAAGSTVWLQALQPGLTSNVVIALVQ